MPTDAEGRDIAVVEEPLSRPCPESSRHEALLAFRNASYEFVAEFDDSAGCWDWRLHIIGRAERVVEGTSNTVGGAFVHACRGLERGALSVKAIP